MLRACLGALAGAVGLLVACEAALQLLPVSSATVRDYYIDPVILTYPPRHHWQVATGWDLRNSQVLRANNFGFATGTDFVSDDRAVALIGDSYVEASMLAAADRPDVQLAAALHGSRPVYALGVPGTALLDYAERIRLASEQFGVRDFVVLMEVGDVRQSLCGSGNVHGPCLERRTLQPRIETVPPPSTLKRVVSRSALAQYLVGQLKLDVNRLPQQLLSSKTQAPAGQRTTQPAEPVAAVTESPEARERRTAMVSAVGHAFFTRIKPYASGRLVIVFDGRRQRASLGDPAAATTPLMREREQFMAQARAHGATVVDAEDLFARHYQQSDLSLDVGPYDAHFNALGVRLLMQEVASVLAGEAALPGASVKAGRP